jgi:hypothetical protein
MRHLANMRDNGGGPTVTGMHWSISFLFSAHTHLACASLVWQQRHLLRLLLLQLLCLLLLVVQVMGC